MRKFTYLQPERTIKQVFEIKNYSRKGRLKENIDGFRASVVEGSQISVNRRLQQVDLSETTTGRILRKLKGSNNTGNKCLGLNY